MRLTSIETEAFGPLGSRTLDLDPAISLIYGANESGKSTFLEALVTLLYGFEPARREHHPLANWFESGGKDLALTGYFKLQADADLAVERLLQERGKSRIARGQAKLEGKREGNHPLPHVRDVPRELFLSIYGLSSDDLVALKQDMRRHVDALLLGESALPNLRPIYRVRAELATEMRRLWSDTRRGKPRAKELKDEIQAAQRKLQTARAEEERLRAALGEKELLEDEIDELRYRNRQLEVLEQDAAFLAELHELWTKKQTLPDVDYSVLDGVPPRDPRLLRERVTELEARLAEPRARLKHIEPPLSVAELLILDHEESIDGIETELGRHAADGEALVETRNRVATLERGVVLDLSRFLGRETSAADAEFVDQFPLAALRSAHEAWTLEWESAQTAPALDESRSATVWLMPFSIGGVIVIALSALGAFPSILAIPAAGLLVAAIVIALKRPPVDMQTGFRAPERNVDVDRYLAQLGFQPSMGATPSSVQRIIDQVDNISSNLASGVELRLKLEALEHRIEGREDFWSQLAQDLDLNAAGTGPQVGKRLLTALKRAREREGRLRIDENERKSAQTIVDASEPELAAVSDEREMTEMFLKDQLPDTNDSGAAFEILEERERESALLEKLADRLRRHALWQRLHDDARAKPDAGQEPIWHPAAQAARQAELTTIEADLATRNRRLGEIDEALRSDEGHRVAEAQDEWSSLRAELRQVERNRDRLALLDRLLAESERAFRDEHQPDVLRRASKYLKSITKGRYVRLDYADDEGDALWVLPAGAAEPIPVGAPLSRGTRDQVYLCLRLGLLDHLDEGRTRLPLVLDEALVHWDAKRRTLLYPLLREISHKRQVILLTCHSYLASEAERALRIQRVDLGRSPAPRRVDKSGDPVLFE